MKVNLPITNHEIVLGDDQMIVSETDLKGVITYVNPGFVEISGFSEAELLGHSHNIVRHPDMPPAAFEDLWDTVKQGRPWIGIVKNRCKNGDFYWVEANVSPLREGNTVVGYMSVRYKPSRAQIEQAEQLYQAMNAGDMPKPKTGLGHTFGKLGLKSRANFNFWLAVFFMLLVGGIGLTGSLPLLGGTIALGILATLWSKANLLGAVIPPLEQAARSMDGMGQGNYKIKVEIGRNDEIGKVLEAIKCAQIRLGFNIAETSRVARENLRVKYALDNVIMGMIIADNDGTIIYHNKSISILFNHGKDQIRQKLPSFDPTKILGLNIDYFHEDPNFQSRILANLVASQTTRQELNGRKISLSVHPIFDSSGKRIGILSEWDDDTKEQNMKEKQSRLLAENTRVKIALDNVSTGVMIADRERKIVYVNKSVLRLLKIAESDIRKQLPNFDADKLLGVNIDSFHKNPAHQASLLETFKQPYTAHMAIGGRNLRVIANPVINEAGERLGAVAEWTDQTLEIATQNEVSEIVQAAARGDFSKRAALAGKEGFFKQLTEAVNQLMDTSEQGLSEVARVLGALARGDLTDQMEGDYEGMFGSLKEDANGTVSHLTEIIQQIKEATDAINTAAKEIAMGNSDLSQRTEEQASSLEQTASSMEELSSTVRQNADNARQANQMAVAASDVAVKGGSVVQQVVGTMSAINDSARKIVDIISVIDGIAFQTNILALNAAVEAARAGEQGRGFAVVAGEVRNLAQRSAAAAKEIKTLIGDSVEKVEGGAKLVEEAGKTMEEIVAAVRRVTDIMAEISAASHEQSSGIEQVNTAITHIDEVTQQNAALVEQAAAAAESLEEQAINLAESVSRFHLSGGPSISAPSRAAKPQPRLSGPGARKAKPAAPRFEGGGDEWTEF
jgi:methyl-accepting chemotaxis protein